MKRETPYIDVDNKTIRNCIIQLLSRNNQMSAMEIFENIVLFHRNVTYPATYKTLKMLLKEKKLLKNNRKFSLNMKWISELKEFIENIDHTSTVGNLLSFNYFLKENASGTFYFKNYEDADKYRKELQWEHQLRYSSKKNAFPYCAFYRHFKSPVVKSGKILSEIKQLKDKKPKGFIGGFLVCGFDTPVDRWCARFYMRNPKIFAKIVPNLNNVDECETMILGDIVVQTYMPIKIRDAIDRIYTKARDINDINVLDFYEKFYRSPERIKISVFNNKYIANMLRSQVIGYFKKNKA